MTPSDGKVQFRNRLLSSTNEQELLNAVAELSGDLKAGSGFAKQTLFLLSQSTAIESVRTAAVNALKES